MEYVYIGLAVFGCLIYIVGMVIAKILGDEAK